MTPCDIHTSFLFHTWFITTNLVTIFAGAEDWSRESYAGMEELTHGQVLQAQICTYTEDGLPVVYIFAIHDSQVNHL